MVFDKVLDNRMLSQQAALDFIANNMESNVWISVCTIDQRLYLRQEFTQDPYLDQAGDPRRDGDDVSGRRIAGRHRGATGAGRQGSEVDCRAGRGGRRGGRHPGPIRHDRRPPTPRRRWRR